jgi:aspartate 1-decarboxylase
MFIEVLKSKINTASITGANLYYTGSITIDEDLTDAAQLLENEKVHVPDLNKGERLDTYVLKGKSDTGEICFNGAAVRKVITGDISILMSYAILDFPEAKSFKPGIIFPDTKTNKLN